MEKRGFGAGARVCFAAAVRWVLRVAGAISLEKEPALSHRTRLGRDVQFEMGPAWSHRTRRRLGNRWWGVATGLVVGWASVAGAATYYVDATNGNDSASGTTTATAWKTINKVNTSTFAAGDQILFKRGETWRESLVPPSSGASGSPIVFDAYGTGEAPTITGSLDLPAAAWSVDSGNVWKASVNATSMSYVLFGTVWGTKQTSKSAVQHDRDFYLSSNVLYVYAPGINPATYYGSVAAMLMANGQLVFVNAKSWLTFQHFRLTYFDTYGVRIGGASDHITVANVYSDGIIPAGPTPHGFYVNASPAPTDIKFYNVDAHRNYDGFKFSGTASGISFFLSSAMMSSSLARPTGPSAQVTFSARTASMHCPKVRPRTATPVEIVTTSVMPGILSTWARLLTRFTVPLIVGGRHTIVGSAPLTL